MENTTEKTLECKGDILLRRVPCEVLEAITRMKIELHQRNPLRSSISISSPTSPEVETMRSPFLRLCRACCSFLFRRNMRKRIGTNIRTIMSVKYGDPPGGGGAAPPAGPTATPGFDDLVKLSTKASGTPHPAVLSMSSSSNTTFPELKKEGENDWALHVKLGDTPIEVILVGKAE